MMYWPSRRRKPPVLGRRLSIQTRDRDAYLSDVLIDVNLLLRLEPSPLTTAIIASAMPAAIRPYSIAVAPDSSAKNLDKERLKFNFPGLPREVPMRDWCTKGNCSVGSTQLRAI
jgi:hypothetical protein